MCMTLQSLCQLSFSVRYMWLLMAFVQLDSALLLVTSRATLLVQDWDYCADL
jgi:hypothetical protein